MFNIGRIDRASTRRHYWQVTIQRWNRVYIRNFPDRRHGGRDQALAAAQAYRDNLLAQHAPMTRQARCAVLKKHNQSGMSGVTRIVPIDRRCTQAIRPACWVARWPGKGRTIVHRSFSVAKYGEWGAYLNAVQARQHGLAIMDDVPSHQL